jgi:hypothetical protein
MQPNNNYPDIHFDILGVTFLSQPLDKIVQKYQARSASELHRGTSGEERKKPIHGLRLSPISTSQADCEASSQAAFLLSFAPSIQSASSPCTPGPTI